jgi:hypothetical protein
MTEEGERGQWRVFQSVDEEHGVVGGDLRGRGFGRLLGGHRLRVGNYGSGLSVDSMIAPST